MKYSRNELSTLTNCLLLEKEHVKPASLLVFFYKSSTGLKPDTREVFNIHDRAFFRELILRSQFSTLIQVENIFLSCLNPDKSSSSRQCANKCSRLQLILLKKPGGPLLFCWLNGKNCKLYSLSIIVFLHLFYFIARLLMQQL